VEAQPIPDDLLPARELALNAGSFVIRALENEQDDRAKVNGLFGSLNDWKG
jgi:hypothetical protein